MKIYRSVEDFLQKGRDFFGELKKGIANDTITITHQTETKGHLDNIYPSHWAQYRLSGFPGCCGILVSHGAWISKKYQGFGFGNFFHKQRLRLAKDMGYSCVTCTTISSNEAEIAILLKNGWKAVHEFVNQRTGNTVYIWVKDI